MKKTRVIHPFLFAVFPVLFLYAHNIMYTPAKQIIAPLAVIIPAVILLYLILRFFFKDREKAGIALSAFLLLFFAYGHIYELLNKFHIRINLGFYLLGPLTLLLIFFSILFLFIFFFCIRTRRDLHDFTKFLNIAAAILVAISLFNIGIYALRTMNASKKMGTKTAEDKRLNVEKTGYLPNIFYIIMDSYGRKDILKEYFGYDNTPFLDFLKENGFYVADRTMSNYGRSLLSVTSSLNFQYLDDLSNKVGIDTESRLPLVKMLNDNRVFKKLKQYGYKTITFDTSWELIRIKNSDVSYKIIEFDLNLFHSKLLSTTPIPYILNKMTKLGKFSSPWLINEKYNMIRKRVLFTFEKLEELSKDKDPFIVFALILPPHQPFVFDENGNPIIPDKESFDLWDSCQNEKEREEYRKGYVGHLKFANKKLRALIPKILSNSAKPPIIIIQGDHGPSSMMVLRDPVKTNVRERLAILNAYYLPDNGSKLLYETITPVNTFRVILNYYFGTDYKLLKDEGFYSTWRQVYKFINVTKRVNPE
ncbi:sulfatase-like hydrolase/transferase [Candidatus Auribacterota bacterium]